MSNSNKILYEAKPKMKVEKHLKNVMGLQDKVFRNCKK